MYNRIFSKRLNDNFPERENKFSYGKLVFKTLVLDQILIKGHDKIQIDLIDEIYINLVIIGS